MSFFDQNKRSMFFIEQQNNREMQVGVSDNHDQEQKKKKSNLAKTGKQPPASSHVFEKPNSISESNNKTFISSGDLVASLITTEEKSSTLPLNDITEYAMGEHLDSSMVSILNYTIQSAVLVAVIASAMIYCKIHKAKQIAVVIITVLWVAIALHFRLQNFIAMGLLLICPVIMVIGTHNH